MDFDFWIGSLKVISMLSAGLFGALGLITKYKDENNRITRWGKTALAGLEVSWALSSDILQRARQIFESTNMPDKVYLVTALGAAGENFVGVKRGGGGQPKVFLFLGRPQGYLRKEYMPNGYFEDTMMTKPTRRKRFGYVRLIPQYC